MFRSVVVCGFMVLVVGSINVGVARADQPKAPLAVTMTNDPESNQINVYNAQTGALLQTLSTNGKGGVGGNARGVRQLDGEVFAAVNNGSGTVAIFTRDGNGLRFQGTIATTSAPVSIDFGNDHMYVAGATTVDSFAMHQNSVAGLDGSATLQLFGGGLPPAGSTAQVGVVDGEHLLVTLKTDPLPGTVDVVALDGGAVKGSLPAAVSAPDGTLTPFGFATYPDATAVITLAHSNQVGLFRGGAFADVVGAQQAADCWMTRVGKYVFTANTGSHTVSRLIGTGNHVFVDAPVAATIVTGGAPADIDGADGILAVVDHGSGQSRVSLFSYNEFGELSPSGTPINVGVANANGIAILPASK
ncbi:MAG TPA: hypothetical protein VF456_29995 [Vicinamibacterales bacterium]